MDSIVIGKQAWNDINDAWSIVYDVQQRLGEDHPESYAVRQLLNELNEAACCFHKYLDFERAK